MLFDYIYLHESKKDGNDQASKQSSTTRDPGYMYQKQRFVEPETLGLIIKAIGPDCYWNNRTIFTQVNTHRSQRICSKVFDYRFYQSYLRIYYIHSNEIQKNID